jgi:organic hydroperoxide reductase OsmC/OhrA
MPHRYEIAVEWTGDRGTGTSAYRAYGRTNVARVEGKPDLPGSADKPFFGDADRWNPEELVVAALSQCHLLSYLHVAVRQGVVVIGYSDTATGALEVDADGGGRLTGVDLHPVVTLADESQRRLADSLHEEAHRLCFIANSVSFPVRHHPVAPGGER